MMIFSMLVSLLAILIGTAGFSRQARRGDAHISKSFRAKQDGQEETPFLSALIKVQRDLRANFFFPGHSGGASLPEMFKRLDEPGGTIFKYDLPELDGLDNIHNPEGPLLHSLHLAAELYGATKTWFLVNGSTGGIMTAILSCAKLFDMRTLRRGHDPRSSRKVMIIARNSHKSVFDALKLCQCDAVLLPVVYDDVFGIPVEVTLEALISVLEIYRGRVCGLLLTRPSYQGVALSSSQLRRVVELAHAYSVPVLVDEAHGAHLRFLARDDLGDAMQCGADISIQSTHKTSTSLTQTGMMHIRQDAYSDLYSDGIISFDEVVAAHDSIFSMLTTTSPNALFIASLDSSRAQCATQGSLIIETAKLVSTLRYSLKMISLIENDFLRFIETLFRHKLADIKGKVQLLEESLMVKSAISEGRIAIDPLRLCIRFKNCTDATNIDDILCERLGIYCELNEPLCITYAVPPFSGPSYTHTYEAFILLSSTLKDVAAGVLDIPENENVREKNDPSVYPSQQSSSPSFLSVTSTMTYLKEDAKVDASLIGRVSAENIISYPPGVPILVDGEVIDDIRLNELLRLRGMLLDSSGGSKFGSGRFLLACSDQSLGTISVYRNT